MKVSDRQSPAEKGHLNLTSVLVLPKLTRSLLAMPADMLSLPPLHRRPFGIWSGSKFAPKANKTSFTRANLHLFVLLRGLEAKKRKKGKKTNCISDSVLHSFWQSALSPSAGTCKWKIQYVWMDAAGSLISLGLSGPDKDAPARVDVTQGRCCDWTLRAEKQTQWAAAQQNLLVLSGRLTLLTSEDEWSWAAYFILPPNSLHMCHTVCYRPYSTECFCSASTLLSTARLQLPIVLDYIWSSFYVILELSQISKFSWDKTILSYYIPSHPILPHPILSSHKLFSFRLIYVWLYQISCVI